MQYPLQEFYPEEICSQSDQECSGRSQVGKATAGQLRLRLSQSCHDMFPLSFKEAAGWILNNRSEYEFGLVWGFEAAGEEGG